MAVGLGDAIRTAGMEGRQLGLRDLADLTEHLARGSLVKADRRIYLTNGLQHARDAQAGELARKDGLVPGRRHEAHRGQVVDLRGLGRLNRREQRSLVEHITRDQLYAIEQVLDAFHRTGAGPASHPDYAIPLLEQDLGQIRAILTSDAGDESCLHARSIKSLHVPK